ncbi:hypothetical protein [Adhaeribacter soli]|uniref:Uncharacterized protein n=1 Tax=Adhaeribacter soli TaxID=2607655 RepID=A0A5N1J2I4_9BACT|nr:hypothetical protein [Adhaeribacter soli]KAA9340257.1 hypothetical protein F0P94_07885 [Adhaeribacter soli]
MNLEEDEYLTIQLVHFGNSEEGKERYYFMEMSSLQATTLLEAEFEIEKIEIEAYDQQDNYLTDSQIIDFKKLAHFNDFFLNHPDYYIHNLDLVLENGIEIGSHDDGEVTLAIIKDSNQIENVKKILKKFNLKESLIAEMRNKPNHYLGIDSAGNVVADYSTFDEYLEQSKK